MRSSIVLVVVMATAIGCGGDESKKPEKDDRPADERFRDECPEVTAHLDKVTDDVEYGFISVSDPGECDSTVYTMQDLIDGCDLDVEEQYDVEGCGMTWQTTCWDMPAAIVGEINASGDPVVELILDGCLWVAL